MGSFKRFSDIENTYQEKHLAFVRQECPTTSCDWIAMEKVHGSNFCMMTDGSTVKLMSRNRELEDDDTSFCPGQRQSLRDTHRGGLLAIHADLAAGPEVKAEYVYVYGELMGGGYYRKDKPRSAQGRPNIVSAENAKLAQPQVYYSPENLFYAFDIYIVGKTADGREVRQWVDFDQATSLFTTHGFFHAEALCRGTLDECLGHPNTFESTIPARLGLHLVEGNIAEGTVIKPVRPMHTNNGARVIFKNKTASFSERASKKAKTEAKPPPQPLGDAANALLEAICVHFQVETVRTIIEELESNPQNAGRTPNRGQVGGRLAQLAIEQHKAAVGADAAEDAWLDLDKKEVSRVKSFIPRRAVAFVNGYYHAQDEGCIVHAVKDYLTTNRVANVVSKLGQEYTHEDVADALWRDALKDYQKEDTYGGVLPLLPQETHDKVHAALQVLAVPVVEAHMATLAE